MYQPVIGLYVVPIDAKLFLLDHYCILPLAADIDSGHIRTYRSVVATFTVMPNPLIITTQQIYFSALFPFPVARIETYKFSLLLLTLVANPKSPSC